ncbi:MAG: hypothetical protein IPM32_07330 [Ignavibacteriae bacterium]|nr:hypothetical protein [Ignavibacteriota bacterium]
MKILYFLLLINFQIFISVHYSRSNINNSTINSIKLYDYLIIADDKFFYDINRFADWKTRKGITTKVVKLSSIGKEWKEIKNFVKHEYEKNNIKFILLVGDVENIPLVYPHTNYSSDIRYGDLDGNVFNIEVPVGRIIPSKKILCYQIFEDVNYAIDKLINYEIQLPADDIINNVLLISHQNKIYNSCSNSIFNKEYINQPKFIKVFGAESGCNEDINTFLSSGVNIVNYRGHAGATGWDSWSNIGESFSGSELNKISYQPWNPIVFSIACFTADLEMEDLTIAEEFVMNKYGAVAFLGATGATENTMNNIFNKKLFSSICNQNIFLLGNIIKNSMNDYSLESCFDRYKYLLIGDPTLEIWTNKSQKFTNVKLIDNKNNVIIKTSIDSCKVCVSSTMSGRNFTKL